MTGTPMIVKWSFPSLRKGGQGRKKAAREKMDGSMKTMGIATGKVSCHAEEDEKEEQESSSD